MATKPATKARQSGPRPRTKGQVQRIGSRADLAPGWARLRASPAPQTFAQPRTLFACTNAACSSPNVGVEDDGTKVCRTCGTIISEDTQIVSDLQFGETSSGAAAVQGSYVGQHQTHGRSVGGARGLRPGFGGQDGPTSREQTQNRAREEINRLATTLNIPTNLTEPALQIFRLAHIHNFVQGRSVQTVAAISLYIACRRRKSTNTLMLIDVAEVLHENVFSMGKIYTKIVQTIYGKREKESGKLTGQLREEKDSYIDMINPENLIRRFAVELEFGEKRHAVVTDAIKLVQRMDRDWMLTGRRASGICGAALILAARMNSFRRTVREVVYIVKVCEITVNKRLEEFKVTESSNLTVAEFRNTAVESGRACDPPAFYMAKQEKKRGRKGRKRKADGEIAAEIEGDETEEDGEGATASVGTISKRRRVDKDGFAIPDIPVDPSLRASAASQSEPPQQRPINQPLTQAVNIALEETDLEQPQNGLSSEASITSPTERSNTPSASAGSQSQLMEPTTSRPKGRPKGSKNWRAPPSSRAEQALEHEIESDMRQILESNVMQQPVPRLKQSSESRSATATMSPASPASPASPQTTQSPTQEPQTAVVAYLEPATDVAVIPDAAAPLTTISPEPLPTAPMTDPRRAGNLGLLSLSPNIQPTEFDDDPEVSICLLTPAEIEIKERIWVEENREWLRQDHAKKIRAELQAEYDKEHGIDPNDRDGKGRKKRKQRRGRVGDVSYLDKDKNKDGAEGSGERSRERSASESTRRMLEQRGFSKKINYALYATLFPEESEQLREGSVESMKSLGHQAQKRDERGDSAGRSWNESDNTEPGLPTSLQGMVAPGPAKSSDPPNAPSRSPSRPQAASPSPIPTQRLPTAGGQLPTPSATQTQSPTTQAQPPFSNEHQDEHAGEEEVLGSISDSPLSSLHSSYISPFFPPTPGAGSDAEAGNEDEESEGDSDDYIMDDDLEAAFEGRLQPHNSYDDEDGGDEDMENA